VSVVAGRARVVLARNPDQVGFAAIVAFLLLTSFRDIYLWSIFQDFSPLHVATLSFGLSALVFLPMTLTRRRHELRRLAKVPGEALLMTGACAVSWITYFCALRSLEPALAQLLCAGVGPITAHLATRTGAPTTRGARAELALHHGILVSLVLAVALELGGRAHLAGGSGDVLHGVAMALVSGVTLAIYRISSNTLNQKGVAPVTILAVRSPVVALVAAAIAWGTGDTNLGAWSPSSLIVVSANCIVLIVLPIFVNQVGVALASPVTAGVASALQPTLLFGLQAVLRGEGRADAGADSPYLALSILVYSCFAVASTVVRSQTTRNVQVLHPGAPPPRSFRTRFARTVRSVVFASRP
jgi:drug/metabolite transporter (DMT)-like permease